MVRIATWNVENLFLPGGNGPKTQADYDSKLDGLTQTILSAGVDAVAVQEIGQPEPFDDLMSRLGSGWSGVLSMLPDVHRGIRVGVISKLPISRVADDADLAAGLPPLQIDYLSALTRATNRGGPDALYRVLDFAQRWVSRGDWSTVDAGLSYAQVTNALIDARNSESDRVHLEVPAWSATGTPTDTGNAAPQLRG